TRRASTAAAATHPPPAKAARRSGVQPCHARSSPHSQEWRASHARNSRTIAFHSSRRSTARTHAAISVPRTTGMSALQLVAQAPPALEAALEHVDFAGEVFHGFATVTVTLLLPVAPALSRTVTTRVFVPFVPLVVTHGSVAGRSPLLSFQTCVPLAVSV